MLEQPAANLLSMSVASVELTPSGRTPCCDCGCAVKAWKCVQCDDSFCDDCWPKQRPHRPGKVGIDGRHHERVDEEVVRRLQRIFGQASEEEQSDRHGGDIDTTWFGVDKDANQSFLHTSNRLVEVLHESQTGEFTERFPQLVSFVGQTGAGKSTVIKMLISREQGRMRDMAQQDIADQPCPVPGLVGDNMPTTGDVHLYSDPGTYYSQKPIFLADCEGMTGGEHAPRGLIVREKVERAKRGGRIKEGGRTLIRKTLAWAKDDKLQSREYAVTTLFPRILYTFSDVVVFVLREVRTFESKVLQQLVNWATMSIDKSINQPTLPHVVIWDPEFATSVLLDDYKDSVKHVTGLRDIVARLAELRVDKKISNTRELLESYYSSVTVVRIPSKGRYMLIDEQIGKLQEVISSKCAASHAHKKKIRMLLNAERLPQYVDSAYDHFSQKLDEPFDFAEEARRHAEMPVDFSDHVLILIWSLYRDLDAAGDPGSLLTKVTRPLASCIMLDAMRDDTQGTYSSLLRSTYYEPLKEAFNRFCEQVLRCSESVGGVRCCNTKNSHSKGHQARNGKIFSKGEYRQPFNQDKFFAQWINHIDENIKGLDNSLQQQSARADRDEKALLPTIHKNVMAHFYKANVPVSCFRSYATCLCCVAKIPENELPCGHTLCKNCVQAFGNDAGQGIFELNSCPLHHSETRWPKPAQIRFKPDEAGVRVLCLDGGGVRGIVELVILRAIEQRLGEHIPVQNFFDLIVGTRTTSTGGIIALALGVKQYSVVNCIDLFKNLCKQGFTRRAARPFRALSFLNHKSYYRTQPLEDALKSVFEEECLLYGGSRPETSTSVKVAVTSTSASYNRPVVLSNYNAQGKREALPYKFLRPSDPGCELKVWEATRATAAAPMYFKPFQHDATTAAYIDGAVQYNCPAVVADSERRLIWDEVSEMPPDIFLSVGTGLSGNPKSAQSNGLSSLGPHDQARLETLQHKGSTSGLGYMWRVAHDIIDSQLNCEELWTKFKHQAEASPTEKPYRRNIRINVPFPGQRPALDDVEHIELMELQAVRSARADPLILEVAHRLVASCFYFQKDGTSYQNRETGEYTCIGNIRCRFEEGSQNLKGLGRIIRDCTHGSKFTPHFFLQENFGSSDQKHHNILISTETINDMCDRGLFELECRLRIDSAWQSSTTRLSLCLQPMDYMQEFGSTRTSTSRILSISGFPRELCAQDSIPSPSLENASDEQRAGWGAPSSMPALTHAKTEPTGLQLQSKGSKMPPRRLMSDPQAPTSLDPIAQRENYGDKWLDDDGCRTEVLI
ncbi:hypothetical protein B0T26DRAFT_800576 [Lasiosphaeria miniovina]|uniref:PNPLA domain-containing protein n=1 Tax=Lasiosphaeria miniovina TaxID=1954250 RepID=A0AA40ATF1_9PEZI|nr:uncharacterized protein B0T26DRAFT_800576 [Lasiosphaeria miniovina]KAK0721616.1 hypothetical protein B0T26DRAFT_800576 [Lasiosphaeria miniovina]